MISDMAADLDISEENSILWFIHLLLNLVYLTLLVIELRRTQEAFTKIYPTNQKSSASKSIEENKGLLTFGGLFFI